MKHSTWRIVPLLFLVFLCFLASGTAKQVRHDEDQTPLQPPKEAKPLQPADEQELAENVNEALSILRKVTVPTISRFTRIARKPKGFLGTTAYYAKEAFVMLFMNTPSQATILPTSTTAQPPKLTHPLSKAVKLLEDAALADNSDAMFLLAEMNFHGNYTHPVNYDQAFKWYKYLADMDGNSTAQYMVGFLYATGLAPSIPTDQAKSMLWHTFAAEQGNTRSQMTLAYRHHAGIATPKDCDEAVHWYRTVANKAIQHYRSGPPGGYSLTRDVYRIADEEGGVFGDGASVASTGQNARHGGPTSDTYADMEDVLEYLLMQSSKGDLRATYQYARLHYDGGRGMKRDFKTAKEYFMAVAREQWQRDGRPRKDSAAGTEKLAAKAAGYLGRMFLRGEGMEQSYSKAAIWFKRGIQYGDALCQYSLGLMHLDGLHLPQDTMKASEYFSAAADQDLAVAQTKLGVLFLDQGDVTTAAKYFEFAARNSHIEAFYYLAEMSNEAIGRDRSCGMAAVYYKIVAEKAEAIWGSLGEANEAYDEGDTAKAVLGYLMAAEQGSEAAQANVAWLLDQTKPRWSPIAWLSSLSETASSAFGDATLALTYWTRSAKQENIDSRVKMGDYYLAGLGAPPSPENAAACYQAAAESMQSAQAMWNLGWMHEHGIGIAQDFHLAKRFYDQALETNAEAYLPVKLSLIKLRWRSWWNDVTGGGIKGIRKDEDDLAGGKKKRRSFAEWIEDFLEADAAMYEQEQGYEADDWGAGDAAEGAGVDGEYWGGGEGADEIDDGILETLLIGGLVAGIAWLWYYRREQQQRRERERQAGEGAGGAAGDGQQPHPHPHAPGQPADRGVFPQPGDPDFGAWVAGGVGH